MASLRAASLRMESVIWFFTNRFGVGFGLACSPPSTNQPSSLSNLLGGRWKGKTAGDVTYGACCVDDFSAAALSADLLIHYGHSCLVPIDSTTIPCLYVFVDIKIDVSHLVDTVKLNFESRAQSLVLAGTIQFASVIRAVKPEFEISGFRVLVPQSKPLSVGEVLGCAAPKVSLMDLFSENPENSILVFVTNGRFYLEAIMIANPGIMAFRYAPYIGKLFLEEYDHVGMKESRKGAILRASWGLWISPARIALFEDSVDACIQVACPRLSFDWGDAFGKPVLNPFEKIPSYKHLVVTSNKPNKIYKPKYSNLGSSSQEIIGKKENSWQDMKTGSPILVILINGDENYIFAPTQSTSNYEGKSSGQINLIPKVLVNS
ncbi:hypothetical protein AHAS_Ahas02G0177500 [Arachis hypogaea]